MDAPDLEFTVEELALSAGDIAHMNELYIARYGGAGGVRDHAVLDAIVVTPTPSSSRELQADDVFTTAANYAFQIGLQRPFNAGNAGTGLLAALVYLQLAGIVLSDPNRLLGQAMAEVVGRGIDRQGLAALLRRLAKD